VDCFAQSSGFVFPDNLVIKAESLAAVTDDLKVSSLTFCNAAHRGLPNLKFPALHNAVLRYFLFQ